MISAQLLSRRCVWSTRYHHEKQKIVESREIKLKQSEIERRNYVPQFVASSTVDSFIDREIEVEPAPFCSLRHGRRNQLCSICANDASILDETDTTCDIIRCDLCSAVAHKDCIHIRNGPCANQDVNDYTDRFTDKYVSHLRTKNEDGSKVWSCELCTKEILKAIMQEQERLRIDRLNRTAYFSAVKLQASCMRLQAQRKYKMLYDGMLRLQARVSDFFPHVIISQICMTLYIYIH